MADAATLQAHLATLEGAYARGVRRVRTPDGGEVEYQSADHLAAAIDRLRRELAAAQAPGGAVSAVSYATWRRD